MLATLDRLPLADDAALLANLGRLLAASAGGSSGVLLSILFSAAAAAHTRGAGCARAMCHGLEQMKALGGTDLGDRTMIDALQPAFDAVCEHGLEAATVAARVGPNSTRHMNRPAPAAPASCRPRPCAMCRIRARKPSPDCSKAWPADGSAAASHPVLRIRPTVPPGWPRPVLVPPLTKS